MDTPVRRNPAYGDLHPISKSRLSSASLPFVNLNPFLGLSARKKGSGSLLVIYYEPLLDSSAQIGEQMLAGGELAARVGVSVLALED